MVHTPNVPGSSATSGTAFPGQARLTEASSRASERARLTRWVILVCVGLTAGCGPRPRDLWKLPPGRSPDAAETISCSSGGHFLALDPAGRLWGWGANTLEELGVRHPEWIPQPALVDSNAWSTVHAATGLSLAVRADGSLWAWGAPWPSAGGPPPAPSPVPLDSSTKWERCSASERWITAVSESGQLRIWRRDTPGGSPTNLPALRGWRQAVATRRGVAAVGLDGSLWFWHESDPRERLAGSRTRVTAAPRPLLQPIAPAEDWQRIAGGSEGFLAIRSGGVLTLFKAIPAPGRLAARKNPHPCGFIRPGPGPIGRPGSKRVSWTPPSRRACLPGLSTGRVSFGLATGRLAPGTPPLGRSTRTNGIPATGRSRGCRVCGTDGCRRQFPRWILAC